MTYKWILKPLLFLFSPETAHDFVFWILKKIQKHPFLLKTIQKNFSPKSNQKLSLGRFQIKNLIGLAAGFDKNGECLLALENFGFGFLEVGTVTPLPQPGNPKPRLFRLKEQTALLNRMGFNNHGANAVFDHVLSLKSKLTIPVGINIGKNKDTPESMAKEDYRFLIEKFSPIADYFVVNVSSPNTPGLRKLQNKDFLEELGEIVKGVMVSKDVFLKLGPDLDLEVLKEICHLCGKQKLFTGLVLTNTLPTDLGGISGMPLHGPSLTMLKAARRNLDLNVPIISVGGVFTAEDVQTRLKEGAQAVQIYTSFVYEGPGVVKKLLR